MPKIKATAVSKRFFFNISQIHREFSGKLREKSKL